MITLVHFLPLVSALRVPFLSIYSVALILLSAMVITLLQHPFFSILLAACFSSLTEFFLCLLLDVLSSSTFVLAFPS